MTQNHHRLRTRITLIGKLFLLASFLMLVAAWNTGANLYYIVFGGLVSFVAVSYPVSRWTLRGITVARDGPKAVHRDTRFPVMVRIDSNLRILPAMALKIARQTNTDRADRFIPSLPPGRTALFEMIHQFHRRGAHRLPAIVVSTGFPLGLVQRTREIEDHAEVVAYPRVKALRPASLEQGLTGGATIRMSHGEGDEFFSLREYIPGDDLRKIAWRPSAKRHMLLVKELEQQTARHIACVLDNRICGEEADFDDRFEEAIELIASVAVTLLNRHFWVSCTTCDAFLAMGEGPAHAFQVLDLLARANPAPATAPDPFQRAARETDTRQVRFVCVSPDPMLWGRGIIGEGMRILHPNEVVHA